MKEIFCIIGKIIATIILLMIGAAIFSGIPAAFLGSIFLNYASSPIMKEIISTFVAFFIVFTAIFGTALIGFTIFFVLDSMEWLHKI